MKISWQGKVACLGRGSGRGMGPGREAQARKGTWWRETYEC